MKETWDRKLGEHIETPKEMVDFFNDIRKVYKKHNLCISHEDSHGSFIIEEYNNDWHENMLWLESANKDY